MGGTIRARDDAYCRIRLPLDVAILTSWLWLMVMNGNEW